MRSPREAAIVSVLMGLAFAATVIFATWVAGWI